MIVMPLGTVLSQLLSLMFVYCYIVAAARIIPSGPPILGQNGYTLTCRIFVMNKFYNLSITYQWSKNNDTALRHLGTEPNSLSFYSLQLSDAGLYTCSATISSPSLSSGISVRASHEVKIQLQSELLQGRQEALYARFRNAIIFR
jgi:hypothetical protein